MANGRPSSWYALGEPANMFSDDCFHQFLTNSPDSASINVLVVPPAGPYEPRDMNIIKQAVTMWGKGIHDGALATGRPWLADLTIHSYALGVDVLPNTEVAWDPDIIILSPDVVAVGYAGIGTDVVSFCHPLDNPLPSSADVARMPGFDGHHGNGWGTLSAECGSGSSGGRVCVVAEGAYLTTPGDYGAHALYDLVAHEFGHCLGTGHVGDASDFASKSYPVDDIMSYSNDPWSQPAYALCVSNLDLKTIAHIYSPLMGHGVDSAGMLGGYMTMEGASGDPWASANQGNPYHTPSSWRIVTDAGTLSADPHNCPQPDTSLVPVPGVPQIPPGGGGGGSSGSPEITVSSPVGGSDIDGSAVLDVLGHVNRLANTNGLPNPTGSGIAGGITIFPTTVPLAYNELVGDVAGSPIFAPGDSVKMHTRFTEDANGHLAGPHGDAFTWHVWAADGTPFGTAPCTTVDDSSTSETPATPGSTTDFDCVASMVLPTTLGHYYTTLQFDADQRYVCHSQPPLADPGLSEHKPCLKDFNVGAAAPPVPGMAIVPVGPGGSLPLAPSQANLLVGVMGPVMPGLAPYAGSDPAGDGLPMPGTDITGFGIIPGSENADTFQVQLSVAGLDAALPSTISTLGIGSGISTQYTVDFKFGGVEYQVYAENFAVNVPDVGAPSSDTSVFALNVLGAGATNFVTGVGPIDGTWDAPGGVITWTVPKADMVVTTAPTGLNDAGVMTGHDTPVAGDVLDTFTSEVRTWIYAGVGLGPGATVWDSGTADEVYTFTGGAAGNAVPTAAFLCTPTGLSVSCDATTSSDSDGTIASYAWTFGSEGSGAGATVQHTFASAGLKSIDLTVTDNGGATGSVSHTVSVTDGSGPIGEHVSVTLGGASGLTEFTTTQSSPTSDWSIPLSLTGVTTGDYTLTATWYDTDGTTVLDDVTVTALHVTAPVQDTCDDNTCAGVGNVAPVVDTLVADVLHVANDASTTQPLHGTAHDDNGVGTTGGKLADAASSVSVTGVSLGSTPVCLGAATGCVTVGAATVTAVANSATDVTYSLGLALPAGLAEGTYTVTLRAVDTGGLSATKTVTFDVYAPGAFALAVPGGALQFGGQIAPGSSATTTNFFTVHNTHKDGTGTLMDAELSFNMDEFKDAATQESFATVDNLVLKIDKTGAGNFATTNSNLVSVDYDGALKGLGSMDAGATWAIKLVLSVPLGTGDGSYGSTFGIGETAGAP